MKRDRRDDKRYRILKRHGFPDDMIPEDKKGTGYVEANIVYREAPKKKKKSHGKRKR